MKILSINNISKHNYITYKQNDQTANKKNEKIKNIALGVGATTMLTIGAGLLSKGNFYKTIEKKGLILKDGILIEKSSGKKYTGEIKSNVGKLGFTKIETIKFVDGIINEKIYKNLLGQELEGYFYKDGKKCMYVQVGYPFGASIKKIITNR